MFQQILHPGAVLAFCAAGLLAGAQSSDDAVRVTVTMNPDGSKTVYQTGGMNQQAIATITGADGKAQKKIVYKLDANGRYESGQVFAPNGSLRFKTRYRYDGAGRLAEETQLGKDDSVRNRIVYNYDAAGHAAGYAVYDGEGRLIGRTSAKAPGVANAP
jgi:hypothetical protein